MANFITEEAERSRILAALPSEMPFDPLLRALFWFGEIDAVRTAADLCRSHQNVWHILRDDARKLLCYWMQRTSGARSSSFALTPSISRPETPTFAQSGATTPNQKRSGKSAETAKSRDAHACVLTRNPLPDVAHLYPFCLTDPQRPVTQSFWAAVLRFFPRSYYDWDRAIFGKDGFYKDTARNLLCFSPDAHRFHSYGFFGLRPVKRSNDGKEVQLEFHWLMQTAAYSKDRRYAAAPACSRPPTTRPATFGPMGSVLVHQPTVTALTSGHVISIHSSDPVSHELPDWDILEFQWKMQLVIAAACAGLPGSAAAAARLPGNRRRNFGFGLDGAADDFDQAIDLSYLDQRLEAIAYSHNS
ncbi:hypothetical protein KEM56_004681 [Ascosphaera pollenicola]|nr:hypothetical protein KEM56_004681 [Ascosphaera pollenicola]